MPSKPNLGGSFTFPGTEMTIHRMGYGAMQLAGPGVYGPPRDRNECTAVLREAVETGINHIDTSDFYGPHIVNEIIKEALSPYPEDLVLVTKVGARRGEDKSWNPAQRPEELVAAVHDNLRNLDVEALNVVNLRITGDVHHPTEESIAERYGALADLQKQGLIKHLGLSNVSAVQFREANAIAPVVCVQNMYNVVHREDDAFVDELEGQGVAYVPFFPLGGFNPLQTSELDDVAASLDASPLQVALAWLLQRSRNILLIPGTSSRLHLRENIAAGTVEFSPEALKTLDNLAGGAEWSPFPPSRQPHST